MKMIIDIDQLKKGDTVIVKDNAFFERLGFSKISGDVFDIEIGNPTFSIKCIETNKIEKVTVENGKIFLIN